MPSPINPDADNSMMEFLDMLFAGLDAEAAEKLEEHEEAIKAAQAMHEQAAVHMIAVRMGDFKLARALALQLHVMVDSTVLGHELVLNRQSPDENHGEGGCGCEH